MTTPNTPTNEQTQQTDQTRPTKQLATFVIFGGTGDLTKKKLVPAFAQLLHEHTLAPESIIVGIARGDFTHDSYKALLLESAKTNDEKDAIRRANVLFYQADSSKVGALDDLRTLIQDAETGEEKGAEKDAGKTAGKSGSSNAQNNTHNKANNDGHSAHQRIFYLATSYTLFPGIVDNLVRAKLNKHPHGVKIIFEKPFGSDLKSAKKIERKLHAVFDEEQMYRIDHYLGKETVQNILMLKFANPVVESLFNKSHVSKIEIVADEQADVGARLGYYNGVGAIKDMIQSHLLQVAALTLMQSPKNLNATSIQDAKVAVLKKLNLAPADQQLVGEYVSFASERAAANQPDLKTETFARLTFRCSMPKWKGVPIIIQTGKKLHRKHGQVVVHFKNNKAIDTSHGLEHIHHNKLVIDIHPHEDIKLFVNIRRRASAGAPNASHNKIDYEPLNFSAEAKYGPNTTDGYKRMIADVVLGDKTLFTRTDEVLASWKIFSSLPTLKEQIRHIVYPDYSDSEQLR